MVHEFWCNESHDIRTGLFLILRETTATIFLVDDTSITAIGIGDGYLISEISDNHVQTIELKDVLYKGCSTT